MWSRASVGSQATGQTYQVQTRAFTAHLGLARVKRQAAVLEVGRRGEVFPAVIAAATWNRSPTMGCITIGTASP